MNSLSEKKDLGAFYTDPLVADFIVDWAIRSKDDFVMDPSFGEGVFLASTIKKLGSSTRSRRQLYGVEIDEGTYKSVRDRYSDSINPDHLVHSDFFKIDSVSEFFEIPQALPKFDAIVGNPPFIRYQRFKGKVRKLAQKRAASLGVSLNGLCSSWAPFVVHSVSFLRDGGRLGMVLPGELFYAAYSTPVLRFLVSEFARITIYSFKKKLFPSLSEDVVILFAESRGGTSEELRIVDIDTIHDFSSDKHRGELADIDSVLDGESRLIEFLLPSSVRLLYQSLKRSSLTKRVGDFGSVGIGYVTGNNSFFHLNSSEVEKWEIPRRFLRKCIRKGSQIEGIDLRSSDIDELILNGESNYLLDLNPLEGVIPEKIREYLRYGELKGVDKSYKCRIRSPWWKVPHIYECSGFFTYFGGKRIRIISNSAGVVAPNSLHIVRLDKDDPSVMQAIAVSSLSSLTVLSTEIEGRSLGGGLLKMEPSEAANTLIVLPDDKIEYLSGLVDHFDPLVREGAWDSVQSRIDEIILSDILGLSPKEVSEIQSSIELLRSRRMNR